MLFLWVCDHFQKAGTFCKLLDILLAFVIGNSCLASIVLFHPFHTMYNAVDLVQNDLLDQKAFLFQYNHLVLFWLLYPLVVVSNLVNIMIVDYIEIAAKDYFFFVCTINFVY